MVLQQPADVEHGGAHRTRARGQFRRLARREVRQLVLIAAHWRHALRFQLCVHNDPIE